MEEEKDTSEVTPDMVEAPQKEQRFRLSRTDIVQYEGRLIARENNNANALVNAYINELVNLTGLPFKTIEKYMKQYQGNPDGFMKFIKRKERTKLLAKKSAMNIRSNYMKKK